MLFFFFNISVNKTSVAAEDSCFSALISNTWCSVGHLSICIWWKLLFVIFHWSKFIRLTFYWKIVKLTHADSYLTKVFGYFCTCKWHIHFQLKNYYYFWGLLFLVGFAGQGVLNKNHTVWIDGARPANTCIPPSFLGNMPAQSCTIPTHPKLHLQV